MSFILAISAIFTHLVSSLFSRFAGLCQSSILDAARNAGLPSDDIKKLQSLLPRSVRVLQLAEYALHRAPRLQLAPLLLRWRLRESSVSPLTPSTTAAPVRVRVRTSVNVRERVLECSKSPAYNLRLRDQCAVGSVNLALLCFERRCQGVRGSGLHIYLYCENCSKVSEIPFLTVGMSRTLAINRRTVFTN